MSGCSTAWRSGAAADDLESLRERGLLVEAGAPGYYRLSPVLAGAVAGHEGSGGPDALREQVARWLEDHSRLGDALECHAEAAAEAARPFLRPVRSGPGADRRGRPAGRGAAAARHGRRPTPRRCPGRGAAGGRRLGRGDRPLLPGRAVDRSRGPARRRGLAVRVAAVPARPVGRLRRDAHGGSRPRPDRRRRRHGVSVAEHHAVEPGAGRRGRRPRRDGASPGRGERRLVRPGRGARLAGAGRGQPRRAGAQRAGIPPGTGCGTRRRRPGAAGQDPRQPELPRAGGRRLRPRHRTRRSWRWRPAPGTASSPPSR